MASMYFFLVGAAPAKALLGGALGDALGTRAAVQHVIDQSAEKGDVGARSQRGVDVRCSRRAGETRIDVNDRRCQAPWPA
jgi:hypothetical protein